MLRGIMGDGTRELPVQERIAVVETAQASWMCSHDFGEATQTVYRRRRLRWTSALERSNSGATQRRWLARGRLSEMDAA